MSLAYLLRRPWLRNLRMLASALVLMAAALVLSHVLRKPRPWPVDKVPIAFWAWQDQAPSENDVRAVIEKAKARAIFLRAGQFDYQDGEVQRIRPVTGVLPVWIDVHLVYNATVSLRGQLETIDEHALAESIATVFRDDSLRAAQSRAHVVGLQLDFDVPTRLLGKYGKILAALRADLEPGTKLSITGLPTWMRSRQLASALTQVDFWVPQFYGAEVPNRVEKRVPISSAKRTETFVNSARKLDKPFFAGLAAYSYALLYNAAGQLSTLRGGIDLATVASSTNLELIEQAPFEDTGDSEWRYVYRTRADGVIGDLAMHAGDTLVVDVPSAGSLRASARVVRELAGEKLLGICIFRLPAHDEPGMLTAEEIGFGLGGDEEAGTQAASKR